MPPRLFCFRLLCDMNHGYHFDSHQQRLPEGFYGEPFPLGYQEGLLSQPKVGLCGLNQHGNLGRKRSRNICVYLHHLDREVS